MSKFEIFSNFNRNINGSLNIFVHPQNTKLSSQFKKFFLHQFAVDFIDNHLDDVIFQKEISMLLGYF